MANPAGQRAAAQMGHDVRTLRLLRNLTQAELALQAGVSLRALKNLEQGAATLRTLAAVVQALGGAAWLVALLNGDAEQLPVVNREGRPRARATGAHDEGGSLPGVSPGKPCGRARG
jgi:transcriptional regulator with XRE-family HTH domain